MTVPDCPAKQLVLPNFLICGAPKAGTSSLHVWIADHPDALGSTEKETYFCVDPDTHMYRPQANIANGLSGYEEYFDIPSNTQPKILLESTPAYIYSKTALKLIPDLPSKPKCLFVLREPAAQIYSMFNYFQTNWSWINSDMSFDEYLEILNKGAEEGAFSGNDLARDALVNANYADFLTLWRDRLGEERIMVRSFDSLRNSPRDFIKEVAVWLGLDPAFYDNYEFPSDNETYGVKNVRLQKFNVAVRCLLPQGSLYSVLKRFYRTLNTHKPSGPDSYNQELIANLALEFKSSNDILRRDFDLELIDWA